MDLQDIFLKHIPSIEKYTSTIIAFAGDRKLKIDRLCVRERVNDSVMMIMMMINIMIMMMMINIIPKLTLYFQAYYLLSLNSPHISRLTCRQ